MIEKMTKKLEDLDLIHMSYDNIIKIHSNFGWEVEAINNDGIVFKRDSEIDYYNELVDLEKKHKIVLDRFEFLVHRENILLYFLGVFAALCFICYWGLVALVYTLGNGSMLGILLFVCGSFPGFYYIYKKEKVSKRYNEEMLMCGILLREITQECIKIKNQ